VLLILVSVQLSYELSRHEGRIRRLAEEVALLQQQITSLNDKDENGNNGRH
jgi:cell division protein ZapA (FtsZ GTPase activity inhibitor)